jgi:hypothetical protein
MLRFPSFLESGLKLMNEVGSGFGAARFGVVGSDRCRGPNELIHDGSGDSGFFERGYQV